ncbi:hypothetical protein P9X10_00500 [Bacillus cereus]|nr:hypothetical protein [Bacillus cereus]
MAIKNLVDEKGTKVGAENKAVSELKPAETSAKKPAGALNLQAQGESILSSKTQDEIEAFGSRSADIEFVNLVTNPWQTVTRTRGGATSKGEESVGAIFKNVGTEPITYISVPNKSFRVMDADFDKATEVTVAPGETFILNYIEVGILLTQDEFASRVTGGDKEVSYSTQAPKDPTVLPTTKLKIKGQSIKDFSVSIADVEADGSKKIKPQFEEKFGIFATRGTRKRSASASAGKPKVNVAGLAVQAIFKQKLGK